MTLRESNIVKGIAILFMIFHHLFKRLSRFAAYGFTGFIGSPELTVAIARDLKVCVALFAFITGFGMVKKMQKAENDGPTDIRWQIENAFKTYLGLIKDTSFLILLAVPISIVFDFSRQPAEIWGEETLTFLVGALLNMTGLAGYLGFKWLIRAWWYLGIAVVFIFIFPFLYCLLKKKVGAVIIAVGYIAAIILIPSVKLSHDNVWRYFPAFFFGMLFAYYGLPEKLSSIMKKGKRNMFIVSVTLLIAVTLSIAVYERLSMAFVFQSFEAVLISLTGMLLFAEIPYLSSLLSYLGKNSKYMWLIHTFVYSQIMGDKLFDLKNVWVIFLIVVSVSFLMAVILRKVNEFLLLKIRIVFIHKPKQVNE